MTDTFHDLNNDMWLVVTVLDCIDRECFHLHRNVYRMALEPASVAWLRMILSRWFLEYFTITNSRKKSIPWSHFMETMNETYWKCHLPLEEEALKEMWGKSSKRKNPLCLFVLVLQAFETFLAFVECTATSWIEAASQDNTSAVTVDMTKVGTVWADTGEVLT